MRNVFRVTDGMRSEEPLTAARAYLEAGLELILTHGVDDSGQCTCGKSGCPHAGKHPISEFFPKGANSATTDIGLIRKALRKYPEANVAMTLGGRTVVDIDGAKGKAMIDSLDLPKTIEVVTKRGFHKHYLGTLDDGAFKADQVDVLTGSSRYVMLPPSRHESGHQYGWRPSRITEAAPVPKVLADLRSSKAEAGISMRSGWPRHAVKIGERNDVLFRTACAIRRRIDDESRQFECL